MERRTIRTQSRKNRCAVSPGGAGGSGLRAANAAYCPTQQPDLSICRVCSSLIPPSCAIYFGNLLCELVSLIMLSRFEKVLFLNIVECLYGFVGPPVTTIEHLNIPGRIDAIWQSHNISFLVRMGTNLLCLSTAVDV